MLPIVLAILHLKYIRVAPKGCRAKMLEDARKQQEEEKIQWENLILSSVKDVENQAIEAKWSSFDYGDECQSGDDSRES